MESSEHGVLYMGTFLYCTSLQDLAVLEGFAVGVDGQGIILFVEPADEKLDEKIRRSGSLSWRTVIAPKGRVGFWFPGFVGEF